MNNRRDDVIADKKLCATLDYFQISSFIQNIQYVEAQIRTHILMTDLERLVMLNIFTFHLEIRDNTHNHQTSWESTQGCS